MAGAPERSLATRPDVEKAPQFGAFLQVFVKKTDAQGVPHFSCLSYPLPPGMSQKQAKDMFVGIAGDAIFNKRGTFYQSASKELMFLSLPGTHFDVSMRGRFLDVPAQMLGIDQTNRKEELVGGVLKEFYDELDGRRHESAQASRGQNIFSLSYRFEPTDRGLYGKARDGQEGKRLSMLALDGDVEHEEMLIRLEERLQEMEDGVVLHIDKSKTVSLCCALFFKEKLHDVFTSLRGTMENILDSLSLYFGHRNIAKLFAEDSTDVCGQCNLSLDKCQGHTSSEEFVGQE